jgi:Tol biopolymer transport system component
MSKPILLLLVSLLLVGCTGTLQVGIERTSTPDVAPVATMAALLADNNRLATQVASQVTPTPAPLTMGRLAYVQGGDIWVKTLPSGVPLRLTTDGHNMDPHWSPSGEWLAFRKDRQVIVEQEVPCENQKLRNQLCMESTTVVRRQVWVIEANATSVHPLYEGASVDAFAWSPTDDRLAYLAAPVGLSIINADGTGLVTVVSQAPADRTSPGRVGRFAWNPDGTSLAYEWRTQALEQPSPYQGLWQVSTDGKTRVELYDSGFPTKSEVTLAGWSPLGKRVLFWQGEVPYAPLTDGAPLYAVSADRDQSKSNAVRLGAEESVLSYSDFIAPAPRGAPPEVRDAVALVVGAGRSSWRNKRIQLAGRDLSSVGLAAISPAWSPDGALLAFSAMPDGGDLGSGELAPQELMQRRIWITNVAGEPRPQRLTNSTAYRDEYPLWSADGGHILFARLDARGRASLWIMASDGSSSRQVVDELTPAPDPVLSYGHVDWDAWFDWWRGM